MQTLPPLPKPHKTGYRYGIPIIEVLLKPAVKTFIDSMRSFKGSYVGVTLNGVYLYIDDIPALRVSKESLDDIKLILADDIREYADIVEYRLTDNRYKQIIQHY